VAQLGGGGSVGGGLGHALHPLSICLTRGWVGGGDGMKVIHHLWIYQEENSHCVDFFAAPPPARARITPSGLRLRRGFVGCDSLGVMLSATVAGEDVNLPLGVRNASWRFP